MSHTAGRMSVKKQRPRRKQFNYCRFLLTFTGFIYYCGFVSSSQLERRKYHNGGLNVLFFCRFKWQPQLRTSLCGTGPLHRHGPPVQNQAHVFACTACPQPQTGPLVIARLPLPCHLYAGLMDSLRDSAWQAC